MNKNTLTTSKIHIIISSLLILLTLGSIIAILFTPKTQGKYIADIYQNGILIQSIPLYEVTEPYTFIISGDNSCMNEVSVCPGSIAIISADCPDKLCIHQGVISNSLLPITCLPNRLVIQLRASDMPVSANSPGTTASITPDIITY